jgi:putative endonuclease
MFYFAYLLKSVSPGINKSYAGYSTDVEKRLTKHNNNKGAKSTRGYKWKLIFKKKFNSKSEAMSYEYKLKKDRLFRYKIMKKFDK